MIGRGNRPIPSFGDLSQRRCCNRHCLRNLPILSAFRRIAERKSGFNPKVGNNIGSARCPHSFLVWNTRHKDSS